MERLSVGRFSFSKADCGGVGGKLLGHGRHRRVGLGCPGGAEHGDGRIGDDTRDDPAHQREVVAEHLHEGERGDRADDSAESQSDRDRGHEAAGAQETEACHRDLHAVARDHDRLGGDRVHSEEREQRHRGRIVADADAHQRA
jgi:hypothetical protein